MLVHIGKYVQQTSFIANSFWEPANSRKVFLLYFKYAIDSPFHDYRYWPKKP